MKPIIDIFYEKTTLPLDIIELILKHVKCFLCNNMSQYSCVYCDTCYCKRCYSPFYLSQHCLGGSNVCVCYKCSKLLF